MLEGKVALITGAARGIGNAIAHKFASEGCNVAFTDLALNEEHMANINKAAEEIAAHGVKCIGYASNAADFAQTEEVVNKIKEEFGKIDILVNNAGIRRDALLFLMEYKDWRRVLDITLDGFYNVTTAVLQPMLRHKHGRIINMASVSGMMGLPGQTNYSAAKAGLIGATKALAKELASRGITVNAIAPGFIATDMTEGLDKETLEKTIPAGRFGRPEEVAALVSFLAGEESAYVTGQVISINGGLYA